MQLDADKMIEKGLGLGLHGCSSRKKHSSPVHLSWFTDQSLPLQHGGYIYIQSKGKYVLACVCRSMRSPQALTVVVTATLPGLLGRAPGEGLVGPYVRPALRGADAVVVVAAVVMRRGDDGDGAAQRRDREVAGGRRGDQGGRSVPFDHLRAIACFVVILGFRSVTL